MAPRKPYRLARVTHDGRWPWDDNRRYAYLGTAMDAAGAVTDPNVERVEVWKERGAEFIRQARIKVPAPPAPRGGGAMSADPPCAACGHARSRHSSTWVSDEGMCSVFVPSERPGWSHRCPCDAFDPGDGDR